MSASLARDSASIARRYSVSVEDLKRWNPISKLTPGKTIALEVRASSSRKGKPKSKPKGKPYRQANR